MYLQWNLWKSRGPTNKARKDSAQGSLSESLVRPSWMWAYSHPTSLVNEEALYHVFYPTPSGEEVQCQYRKRQNGELSCQIG